MLYITAALYEEAAPFLAALSLKKEPSFRHFDLFLGDNAMLLLTKTGAMRAAVATSSFLTTFPPQKNDMFLSVGTAACLNQSIPCSSAFILQQIIDAGSGRSVYPELIYRSPFPEARLTTVPQIITSAATEQNNTSYKHIVSPMLYDMESSGIYEAAIPYFLCEQLLFCRIVSDHAVDLTSLSYSEIRKKVTLYIAEHTETIIRWIQNIEQNRKVPKQLSEKHIEFYERVCAALRLSTASQAELKRMILYLYLNNIDYLSDMEHFLSLPLLSPCKTKKEGLFYLGQLKKHFL